MNLKVGNIMYKSLNNILNDLSNYHRNKKELLIYYINQRLNKSLETYYKDLSSSYNYLSSKDTINVAKKFNRS